MLTNECEQVEQVLRISEYDGGCDAMYVTIDSDAPSAIIAKIDKWHQLHPCAGRSHDEFKGGNSFAISTEYSAELVTGEGAYEQIRRIHEYVATTNYSADGEYAYATVSKS